MALSRDYFQRFGLPLNGCVRGRRPGFASFGGPAPVEVKVPSDLAAIAKEVGMTIEEYQRYLTEAPRGMSPADFKAYLADLARKAQAALNQTSGTTSVTATSTTPTTTTEKQPISPWMIAVGAFVAWKLLK